MLPSWTQSVSDERRQESGILFVILCNPGGEQRKKQRQLMRNLWANNLPQPHNIVFLVTHNNAQSDELLQERNDLAKLVKKDIQYNRFTIEMIKKLKKMSEDCSLHAENESSSYITAQ